MALILTAAAGGSPGVTTTSLGLALHWQRDVLLADCDRHPNQAVLAGYLRGLPAGGRGLGGLAQGYRTQESGASSGLLEQTVALDDRPGRSCRFLPGFTHPRAALLFDRYWARLAAQFDDLAGNQTDVIADCGRLDADILPEALVARAQAVVLLTRSHLPALAALRLFLPELVARTAESATDLLLVVVGGGRPYSAAEIARQLELPLLADLPLDAPAAAMLSDGVVGIQRLAQRPLWRGLHGLSQELSTRLAIGAAASGVGR